MELNPKTDKIWGCFRCGSKTVAPLEPEERGFAQEDDSNWLPIWTTDKDGNVL